PGRGAAGRPPAAVRPPAGLRRGRQPDGHGAPFAAVPGRPAAAAGADRAGAGRQVLHRLRHAARPGPPVLRLLRPARRDVVMHVNDRGLIGQEVAGYYVEDIIGKGGMAVVYLALDPRLSRRVALKILNPVLSVDDRFRQRFILESRTVASIEHPNIIPIYEANADADGVLYIAMRYVDGLDLRRFIYDRGPLPLDQGTRIFAQVAAALDAAHAHDLIHRDVKPANILLAGDHVYLTDFGITKHRTSISGLTQTDQFIDRKS